MRVRVRVFAGIDECVGRDPVPMCDMSDMFYPSV